MIMDLQFNYPKIKTLKAIVVNLEANFNYHENAKKLIFTYRDNFTYNGTNFGSR